MNAAIETRDLVVVPHPSAPQTLEASGLPFDFLEQLVIKTLHFSGEMSGALLARTLGVQHSVIEPILAHLKQHHLGEISGGGLTGGPAFVYRLTDAGRIRAMLFVEQNQYVGVAPVPFDDYDTYMRAFAFGMPKVATRERVRQAFDNLVLSQRVLDQLGPAVNGAHSLFVYGPPGNGKTVISQSVRNLLDGEIAVPRAIFADGHVIQVYDPVVHEPVRRDDQSDTMDGGGHRYDARWVACRRPEVVVGGELELEDLELSYSTVSKFYQAPVQLAANGGVLVIDDFGRQKCSPVALLNRWIMPLESRIDTLTLQTGQKLPVPFVVLVVFATNIRPAQLVDEAFLRRIRYKVFAESPTRADYKTIFRRCCAERDLEYDDALVDRLIDEIYVPRSIPLRGSHPRDLIDHVVSLSNYLDVPRQVTMELLRHACNSYFIDEQEQPIRPE